MMGVRVPSTWRAMKEVRQLGTMGVAQAHLEKAPSAQGTMGSGVLFGAYQGILLPTFRPAAAIRHPGFLPPSAERPGEHLPSWVRHVPPRAPATPFPSLGHAAVSLGRE